MITICLSIFSSIIALISLFSSIRARKYQKNKDNNLLKPQLLLESQKKSIIDYIGINSDIEGQKKLERYNVLLNLINITEVKIIDLFVSINVVKNDTFKYLLDKALKEKENNFYSEIDAFGKIFYSWDKVFGMPEQTEKKVSILEGGKSFELELPGIFSALLLGAMYANRKNFKKNDFEIEFDINISYNHALTKKNKYVKIKETFPVRIVFVNTDILQGPYAIYDSFIFKQLW